MLTTLLLTATFIIPLDPVVRESVDLTHVNHFYDEHGRLVFDQVIFYDWSDRDTRYNVRAWRMLKHESQVPVKDQASGDWVAAWLDGETLRQVRAKAIRESWTQFDPELVEREVMPKEMRRELRRVKH